MERIFKCVILGILVMVLLPVSAFCQNELGKPMANIEVQNLVPFELVQKIALKKAHDLWGEGTLGKPLPCCDDNGDIVAYMFPFCIGRALFPNYGEILGEIRKGRRIIVEGFKAMSEAERNATQEAIAHKAERLKLSPKQPPLSAVENRDETKTALMERMAKEIGKKMSLGIGTYGTVVVSARYDRFPVPLYMHYLPPYYTVGDLAADKAKDALESEVVSITKVYFLGRGRGQYFEFVSGIKKALINSYSLKLGLPEKVLTRRGKRVVAEPKVKSLIDNEWEKLKKEVQ